MTYMLLLIVLTNNNYYTTKENEYNTMTKCFEGRDKIIEQYKRPIVNYQAICVIKSEK